MIAFVAELFLLVFFFFVFMSLFLGVMVWFRARRFLQNPFGDAPPRPKNGRESNVIEGQYTVLDDSRKE